MIEGGTPNTLFRRGVNKNSLPDGTVIIVDGYQAKDGTLKSERARHHVDGRFGSSSSARPAPAPPATRSQRPNSW
jgi:hypothetical protein